MSILCLFLQGPEDDQEDESELTITEMKNQREQKKKEEELLENLADDEPEKKKEDSGCSWGMGKFQLICKIQFYQTY